MNHNESNRIKNRMKGVKPKVGTSKGIFLNVWAGQRNKEEVNKKR